MIKTNVHQAKTHLSRLLKAVQKGETVLICRGEIPVARLVAVEPGPNRRPPVGQVTSGSVRWTEDAFAPLTDAELKTWGL
ncbi:MAG: type II toxin-antitoxin system Phd/YefM family antitoxin [Planctomycetes bacterium]|nr:type II toxin-antitoxin system Phd/YefM family antitoxin [Planctomycetota bacterium]